MEHSKRITIPVTQDMDILKERLEDELGIQLSYVQFLNYVLRVYIKHKEGRK